MIKNKRAAWLSRPVIFIPCQLIWSVKIRWTQKLALLSTLCLTILTIMCTIVRIAGMHTGRTVKSIDSVWGTYWQFIAANIALTMTAVTAFRTFFVSRGAEDRCRLQGVQDCGSKDTLYSKQGSQPCKPCVLDLKSNWTIDSRLKSCVLDLKPNSTI